jgi:hypothetical protein
VKEWRRVTDEREYGTKPAQAAADQDEDRDGRDPSSDRVGIGGGDEDVAKMQLATRWAELYAPDAGDTLELALRRFRRAYTYVDAVTKFTEPDEA